jgi:uroporphyrinogen decarboxylase
MKRDMTSSERFRAALSGADMDRIPMYELCYWPKTLERWRGEGLAAGIPPQYYFHLDQVGFFAYDGSLGLPGGVVQSDAGTVTTRDGDGVYYRESTLEYSTPTFVRATINTPADWRQHRGRLTAGWQRIPERMDQEPVTGLATGCATPDEYYRLCKSQERFTVLSPIDPIWYALRVMGEEQALMAIAEDPDFVQEIVEDYALFNESMLRLLLGRGYRFDAVWVFSDLCYKNGMLFSPRFFRERVLPTFSRYVALCHEASSKFIFHCDGDVTRLIPLLLEAGVDCIQPLEARAGNDVRILAPRYGETLSFMGNINADVLSGSREGIEQEIRDKLSCAAPYHRYLFHSDHSIPPGVSFANYAFAVELAKKYGSYR